jgi:hypothetical protein
MKLLFNACEDWEFEAFKLGDPELRTELWMGLQGKPLSPAFHEFILRHFIEGKPFRERKRPTESLTMALVQYAYLQAIEREPNVKKTAIYADLSEFFGLSVKRIEQIIYHLPKSSRNPTRKNPGVATRQ